MVAITTRAGEQRAVTMTNLTTARAGLAAITWVNIGYSNVLLQSFILNEFLKLEEGPRLLDIPLSPPHLSPLSDMLQVFHNQNIARSSALNYSLANNVVKIANYPTLLARKPFQKPFSSFSAFGLERSPQIRKMSPCVYCLFAREPETVRSSSDIVDTEVYSDGLSAFRSGDWLGKNDIDVKAPLSFRFPIDQSSRSGALSFKKMPLVVTKNERNFNSTFGRGERHHLFNRNIAKYSLVIRHRGWLELLDFAKFPLRRFSYPGNGSYGKIGSQAELLLKLIVAEMLELYFVGGLVCLRYLKHIITGIGKAIKGSPESFSLLRSSTQLTRYCLNKFHSYLYYITLRHSVKRGGGVFLPSLKGVGFLRPIL